MVRSIQLLQVALENPDLPADLKILSVLLDQLLQLALIKKRNVNYSNTCTFALSSVNFYVCNHKQTSQNIIKHS